MSRLPKISVVTPSFNQGKFLEETVKSVLSQEYPDFEYIIIDGGSRDNSIDIINKYQHRLAYWVSEKDSGFGNAINKGFSRATGEIFCWVNSDDLLLPGALDTVGKYFADHPNISVVFGDRHAIDENSRIVFKKRSFFFFRDLLRYKTIPQEATFWRREIFLASGGIDENLRFAIDLDLWCKFSKLAKFRHLPFYFGAFRIQPESKSSTINQVGKQEKQMIIKKYFHHCPSQREIKLFKWALGNVKRLYRFSGIHYLKILYYSVKLK